MGKPQKRGKRPKTGGKRQKEVKNTKKRKKNPERGGKHPKKVENPQKERKIKKGGTGEKMGTRRRNFPFAS